MARLIVITTEELALGYRLAGAATTAVTSADEARRALARFLAEPDVAVIAIHGPYYDALPASLLDELTTRILPVVIDVPTGAAAERKGRRARLADMLRHAIGHQITFRTEGGAP